MVGGAVVPLKPPSHRALKAASASSIPEQLGSALVRHGHGGNIDESRLIEPAVVEDAGGSPDSPGKVSLGQPQEMTPLSSEQAADSTTLVRQSKLVAKRARH